MCVAIVCETKFPSKKVLRLCEEKNPDGGGIAWVENGVVKYKKGIGYRRIWKITKSVNPPAMIHFRIATAGGINPALCHPFPINEEATVDTEGETHKVLMHNGHWMKWRETCLKLAINRDLNFPRGPWSDSRAMAWLASSAGSNILELLDEKIALLTGNKKLTLFGKYWTERDGIFYSNLIWEPIAETHNHRSKPYGLNRNENRNDFQSDLSRNRGVGNAILAEITIEENKEAESKPWGKSEQEDEESSSTVEDDTIYMKDVMDELKQREEDFRSGSSVNSESIHKDHYEGFDGIDN